MVIAQGASSSCVGGGELQRHIHSGLVGWLTLVDLADGGPVLTTVSLHPHSHCPIGRGDIIG